MAGAPVSGLLIEGELVPLPGLVVIAPASHGGPPWARLDPGDYAARHGDPSLVVVHTTGGHWPQPIRPGAGPSGHAQQIADLWRGADHGGGERVHSGAHLVVDYDGAIVCLADLARCAAFHAQAVNDRAIGIELCTLPDGGIYEATLTAGAALVAALTWSGQPTAALFAIPAQMPRGPYRGMPCRRLERGSHQVVGADLVGVIGHRDQTERRGRGDPGDAIWTQLAALGFEGCDFDGAEDLELGRARQRSLNAADARSGHTWAPLVLDGVAGPRSLAAARRRGFTRWRDVPAS